MSHLYVIPSVIMLGTSLFAMDKDPNPNNSKQPESYRMESKLFSHSEDKEKGIEKDTYKYSDGSTSTYFKYKNPLDKKK